MLKKFDIPNDKRGESVDELITAVPGGWKFSKQVAQNFDSHVQKSVPIYNEVQKMVVEMSEWFIRDGSYIYDIGSSTGKTISLLAAKHSRKRNVKFIGIESSTSMIKQAKKKCNGKNIKFLHQDVAKLADFSGADFVTSIYTLQFLSLDDRRKVIRRIYKSLSEGGALVMAEKIRAESSFFEDMWLELHWDYKRSAGFTTEQIIQKARSLRGVLLPITLSENIELLREVGFSTVDTFMKWYNFAGIIAIKSEAAKLSENGIEQFPKVNLVRKEAAEVKGG